MARSARVTRFSVHFSVALSHDEKSSNVPQEPRRLWKIVTAVLFFIATLLLPLVKILFE